MGGKVGGTRYVKMGGKRWYDTTGAAELIGKTPRMVRFYIERGRLRAKRVDRAWLISENSLGKFLRRYRAGKGWR